MFKMKNIFICLIYIYLLSRGFARKGEVSSLCPMCKKETENTAHFILQCASLQEVRKPFMDKVFSYLRI
jgi:hypothetical protein